MLVTAADRLAIMEQLGRYSYAEDGRDPDAYAALFTKDATFEVYHHGRSEPVDRVEGRDAIREWATARYARQPSGAQIRHHQTAIVFDELSELTARTHATLTATRLEADGVAPTIAATGSYTDDWRKTEDGWLFQRRVVRTDHG